MHPLELLTKVDAVMAAYREDRRAEKAPRINRITKNEANETTDLKRQTVYERERERLSDELRRKRSGRTFGDLVKPKK